MSHILVTSASRLLHHDFQRNQTPKRKEKAWNVLTDRRAVGANFLSLQITHLSPHKPRMQILSSSSTLYVTVTFRTNLPSKSLSFSFYFSLSLSFLYITSQPSRRLVLLKAQRVEESYHSLKNQSWIKAEVTQNRRFQLLPKAQYTQKNERYAFMPIRNVNLVVWKVWFRIGFNSLGFKGFCRLILVPNGYYL